LLKEKVFNHCGVYFGKPQIPEPGQKVASQMTAVLDYSLPFECYAFSCPPSKMGSAFNKHILGKILDSYGG
jgi:hypothetical protein